MDRGAPWSVKGGEAEAPSALLLLRSAGANTRMYTRGLWSEPEHEHELVSSPQQQQRLVLVRLSTARGLQKKGKENKEQKNNPGKKQPTDFPFLFVFRVEPYARRIWTFHRMRAPAAGCGVFLHELVPSDDPFVWCLCETFFLRKFVTSILQLRYCRTAVQSKSNSHVNVYDTTGYPGYQPVEFTSFCLVCWLFCF
jgi:hypothetical protein